MAEDLNAIKYFSTFPIFTASFQISAFLKMNAIWLSVYPGAFLLQPTPMLLFLSWWAREACELNLVRKALLSIQPVLSLKQRQSHSVGKETTAGDGCLMWHSSIPFQAPLIPMFSCTSQTSSWGPDRCFQLASWASAWMFPSSLSFIPHMRQFKTPESRRKLLRSSLYYYSWNSWYKIIST